MKADLEKFKMNKLQMNNIVGGKREFDCHVSAAEFGGPSFDVKYEADDSSDAEKALQKEYGDEYSIFCK